MKNVYQFILFSMALLINSVFASESLETLVIDETLTLEGTLETPNTDKKVPLAIIVGGSGPTDRNGNQPTVQNNSLMYLSNALLEQGIATFRYDKRGVGKSQSASVNERALRFEHYANDIKLWIKKFRQQNKFSSISLIGHSEGGQLSAIAANLSDKYISISAPGMAADELIRNQLAGQPEQIRTEAGSILTDLKAQREVANVPQHFYALFRPSAQPYLMSWFKDDPQTTIKKVHVPTLIIAGEYDIQVPAEHAKLLNKAQPSSKLVIIPKMNHVLKTVSADKQDNIAAYSDPTLPVSEQLIKEVSSFIKAG